MKDKIEITDTQSLTPSTEALYEVGKSVLKESLNISRDFSKQMISFSFSAIPIYLALLKIIISDNTNLNSFQGCFVALPCLLFLVSAIIFTLAYFPKSDKISLELPEEIKESITEIIKRRKKLFKIGFIIFCLAIISMIGVYVLLLIDLQ